MWKAYKKCKHRSRPKKPAASTPSHKRNLQKEEDMKKNMAKILAVSKAAWPTWWQRLYAKLRFTRRRDIYDEHGQLDNLGAQ